MVLAVRRLALGQKLENRKQLRLGFLLGLTLGAATAFRTAVQRVTSFNTGLALSASMFCIVFTAVIVGNFLPQLFYHYGIDPGHASATIQVSMDIIGITTTCLVCTILFHFMGLPDVDEPAEFWRSVGGSDGRKPLDLWFLHS